MNRQPFYFGAKAGGAGTSHYYDEDVDRRTDMGHGITLVRLIKKRTKKPTVWDYAFINQLGDAVGGVTHVRGWNIYLRNSAVPQRGEIQGLTDEAKIIPAAKLLIEVLYS